MEANLDKTKSSCTILLKWFFKIKLILAENEIQKLNLNPVINHE